MVRVGCLPREGAAQQTTEALSALEPTRPLPQALMDRYTKGFIEAWQGELRKLRIKPLTADNLKAAITAMETQTGDHGRPLGISPNLLVVPKAQRFAANKLLTAELLPNAAGTAAESNDLRGAVELLVADWL